MIELMAGLVLFLGVHSVSIVAPVARDRWAGALGENGWKGLYSVLSLAGLVLIAMGYGAAREAPVILYTPPAGLRHLAALLMLPVFILLLAAYLPGRIQRAARHPMLAAVKFWALAHLLANGSLADVLLFGGFLAWAVADRISVKRRAAAGLRVGPPLKLSGPDRDLWAVIGGLLVYGVFAGWAHGALFGVRPFGG